MLPPTLVKSDPRLFLGPSPDRLERPPPGRVISLCRTEVEYPGQLLFPMRDHLSASRIPDRALFEAFLERAHAAVLEGPTYWHCHRGINRSGFALAAYLTLYQRKRISFAIARLRRQRSPFVLHNATFERTLRTWYGGRDEQDFEPLDVAEIARRNGIETTPSYMKKPIEMPEKGRLEKQAIVIDVSE